LEGAMVRSIPTIPLQKSEILEKELTDGSERKNSKQGLQGVRKGAKP
jgi:hypothetical protein